MAIEIKLAAAAVMVAFGITVPLPAILAGLVIAVGGCYAVMIVTEPTSRLSVWGTLFVGGVMAMLAAILHGHFGIPEIPVQAKMAVAGIFSKPLLEASISFGKGLKDWAHTLPGKLAAMFNIGGKK